MPLERDEGEYAYAAQQLLRGVPPFESIYHVKLPGIYGAYALAELAFGPTLRGVRLGLLAVNLATLAVLFALAWRLLGPLAAGVAAAAFGVLSLGQGLTGFAANAEHYVLLPGLLGLHALLAAPAARRPRALLFLAGLGVGLAYVIKQQGLLFFATGAALGLSGWLAQPPRRARTLARDGAAYALGAVVPLALLCAIFLGLGLFGKFWWWTWYYPRRYVTQISLADGWSNFWLSFHPESDRTGVLGPFWPLLALAGLGLLWLLWKRSGREAVLCGALLLFSLLALSAGLHFFPHYYLLATPVLALLAGAGACAIAAPLGRGAALAVAAAVVGFAVHTERAYLFALEPGMVSRTAYGANPFPESLEIARFLSAHSAPDDRIAVLGSEPQIYFYAKRRAATGYVYTYEMMRDHPHVRDFQTEMAREIEAARPKFVVMVNLMASWQPSRLAQPDLWVFEWAERFLREQYQRVGLVEIRWPLEKYGRFCWDAPGAPCRTPAAHAGVSPLWLSIHERLPDSVSPRASAP